MKKRILAVVLAVLMIASCCVLFASALEASAGDYLQMRNQNGGLLVDNLKKVTEKQDFDIPVKVSAKSSVSMNSGTTQVDASNVDELFDFKNSEKSLTYTFKSNIADYYTVSGTISGDTAEVSFIPKTENNQTVYVVNSGQSISSSDTGDVSSKLTTDKTPHYKYIFEGSSPYEAKVTKWVTKLADLTMGVRFYGTTYKNLVASEIATVTATVTRNKGAVSKVTTSVSDKVSDLLPGDTVYLTQELKPSEKEFYAFNCWVDGSGEVLSTNPTHTVVMAGTSVGVYAVYVELKNRHTITYSIEGEGDMVVLSNKNDSPETRGVFDGTGQISVMEGKDFTFTFVPKEGYEISKVIIDGTTNVASFKSVLTSSDILKQIKTLINATGADRDLTSKDPVEGAYTFSPVVKDHSIKVVFAKANPIEAPSAEHDLPLMAPEGVELETRGDAAAPGAEGAAAGGTTVPAENGAAGGGAAIGGVVNPATGSGSAIAVFAVMTAAAGAAFVTMKKKKD